MLTTYQLRNLDQILQPFEPQGEQKAQHEKGAHENQELMIYLKEPFSKWTHKVSEGRLLLFYFGNRNNLLLFTEDPP